MIPHFPINIIILILSLISIPEIYSQNKLTGIVKDSDGNGIGYVKIIVRRDSAIICHNTADSVGRYEIRDIEKGQYEVSYGFLGYSSLTDTVELQDEVLRHDVILHSLRNLDEVTVRASRFVRSGDKLIVTPSSNQIKHSTDAYGLLDILMIPGIKIDNNGVRAFGEVVTIYIDGVKASELDLKNLRPKEILKVEFMTAPSGRYLGDITALNFVLHKVASGGFVYGDAMQRIAYLNGNYNVTGKVYRGNSHFSIFGGYEDIKVTDNYSYSCERFLFNGISATRTADSHSGISKHNNQYIQLNSENSTDRRQIKISGIFVRNASPVGSRGMSVDLSDISGVAGYKSFAQSKDQAMRYGTVINFMQSIRQNQSLRLNLTGNYIRNHHDYSYTGDVTSDIFSNVRENAFDWLADLNYIISFRNGAQLTSKLLYSYRVSMSDYLGSVQSWQHLRSGESMAYAEYLHRFGKMSLRFSPGVSWLQYCVHGHEVRNEVSPRLSFMLTWQPRTNSFLMLNGAIGNSYPTMALLSDVDQNVNEFMITRGNPLLDVTKMYRFMSSYNITLRKVNIQTAVVWQIMKDLPVTTYTPEDRHIVRSFASDVTGHNLNAYIAFTMRPVERLGISLSANYGLYDYGERVSTLNRFSGSGQISYYFGEFSVGGHVQSSNAVLGTDLRHVTIPCSYGVTGGWAHKGFSMTLGFENPFSRNLKYRFKTITPYYENRGYETSAKTGMSAYLKVSYTFDFGQKTNHIQFQGDKTINSAILK